MPSALLTTYECAHDLMPGVCVRCGSPATTRVPRPVPVPPRAWKLVWILPTYLAVYLALPFTIVLWGRLLRKIVIRVPTCATHADDWAWRGRTRTRYLWPAVCVASVAVEAACLAGLILHPALFAHAAAGVIVVGFGIDCLTVGRGEVLTARGGRDRVRLAGVHPAFVTALIEDRARDRVENPDRRTLRGDVREDYDDEPV